MKGPLRVEPVQVVTPKSGVLTHGLIAALLMSL
jgi:hypothetical protein